MKNIEKFFPNALVSATYILFLFLYFFNHTIIMQDADTGWHLAAGDIIRQWGEVPDTDPWAFTTQGYAWFNISWLFDTVISYLKDTIGLENLIVSVIVLGAVMMAAIARFCVARKADGLFAALMFVLTGIMFSSGILLRPQLVTYISVLIFYFVLHRINTKWDDKTTPKNDYKILLLLPLTMLLWVNVHGGFIAGFLILGAYGVENMFRKRWSLFTLLVVFGIICLLVIPLNPLGFDLLPAIFRTLDSVLRPYIQEWQSPKILKDVVMTAYLIVFLLISGRDKRLGIADNLIAMGWLLLALSEGRHKMILALLACPYITISVTDWIRHSPHLTKIKTLDENVKNDCKSFKGRFILFSIACALTVAICTPSTRQAMLPAGQNIGWQSEHVAFEEMKFIETNYPDVRFLNHYNFGGHLIYFTKIKVFIDGRTETAYPKRVARDYVKFHIMGYGWEEIFNKYNIGGAFMPKEGDHKKYFDNSSEWDKVFEGDLGVVYIRKTAG